MVENKNNRDKFQRDLKDINEILEDTPYHKTKKAIKELFNKTNSNSKEDIILRLIVIDSSYSTNMNRRYFGFEELTDLICSFKNKLKKDIDVKDFIEKNFDKMNTKVGIDKKGNRKKHSFSLLTKYIYFQTDFNFPIYDSLVLNELNKEFKGEVKKELSKKYFFKLIKLKEKYKVSFDELDKYYWFKGKVKRGNLSLLIPDSKTYMDEFISKLFTEEKIGSKKSSELDSTIADKLKKNNINFKNRRLKLIQKLARKFQEKRV